MFLGGSNTRAIMVMSPISVHAQRHVARRNELLGLRREAINRISPEEIRASPAFTFIRTAARSVDLFLSRGGLVCS